MRLTEQRDRKTENDHVDCNDNTLPMQVVSTRIRVAWASGRRLGRGDLFLGLDVKGLVTYRLNEKM